MRWHDERYVRVYTRDTADWLALSFEAQGLWPLILRKLDRAGILELGRHGKRAVAIAIGHAARWEAVEPALEELLADGCLRIEGTTLVAPNFIEAQETTQSDAQRKRESRAKARDKLSRNVTECPAPVTSSHKQSQTVTPNCAVPNCTVPNSLLPASAPQAGESTPKPEAGQPATAVSGEGMATGPTGKASSPPRTKKTDARFAPLREAWEQEYAKAHGGTGYRWSPADSVGIHRVIAENPEELRARARRSFANPAPFLRCGSLAKLTSGEVWNQLAGPTVGVKRVIAEGATWNKETVQAWKNIAKRSEPSASETKASPSTSPG